MMELDYSEIHHSRKIRGTEQAESTEDNASERSSLWASSDVSFKHRERLKGLDKTTSTIGAPEKDPLS